MRKVQVGIVLAFAVLGVAGACFASPPRVPLPQAIAEGLVRVEVYGTEGIAQINVVLISLVDRAMVLLIPAGTLFSPGVETVQRMVVVKDVDVFLQPGARQSVTVPVGCYDMDLDQPEEGVQFTGTVGWTDLPELVYLTRCPEFQTASMRIRQFSIWILREKPAEREDLNGLPLGPDVAERLEATGFPLEIVWYLYLMPDLVFDLEPVEVAVIAAALTEAGLPVSGAEELYLLFDQGLPTAAELAQIAELFRCAGIPTEAYPVLNEQTEGGA